MEHIIAAGTGVVAGLQLAGAILSDHPGGRVVNLIAALILSAAIYYMYN